MLGGLAAAPLAGCTGFQRVLADPPPGGSRLVIPGLADDGTTPALTLRQKIGQMVLTGFDGLTAGRNTTIGSEVANGDVTGVVLFDYDTAAGTPRNIQSPQQLQALTSSLQSLDSRKLFIAVDEEGGQVARLSPANGYPATQSAAALGKIDDPSVTYDAGAAIARTLASAGINLNFAPVVDLNVNPDNPIIGHFDRSFSADPDVVTRNAEAFIRAHHDNGVLTTLKHFPGHGSSRTDSHKGFVDVTDTWSPVELQPFQNIIHDGLADLVLVAHIFNAHLDPTWPASLSHATVTGLLREQIGYDGVVITDSMGMAAITDLYSFETAIQKAIEAGVDILLYASGGSDGTVAERVIAHIESLVTGGVISESRINESLRRIEALRSRL